MAHFADHYWSTNSTAHVWPNDYLARRRPIDYTARRRPMDPTAHRRPMVTTAGSRTMVTTVHVLPWLLWPSYKNRSLWPLEKRGKRTAVTTSKQLHKTIRK